MSNNSAKFQRLSDFLARIPSIGQNGLLSHGSNDQHAWWIKFNIDIQHPLAWATVQELGHVLNYISAHERLPTTFFPVSPPPYMNGGPHEFLSWVIECDHADFPPDVIAEWLEGRLPTPVDDESQWLSEKMPEIDDEFLHSEEFQAFLNGEPFKKPEI